MRKVVFAINISTDGYCGHTDMIADAEMHEYFIRLLRNASLLLFGRITYQLMVPYWPDIARTQSEDKATNEFARVFDSLDKVVFSTTLEHVEGQNTRIRNREAAGQAPARLHRFGHFSIRRRGSPLQKTFVRLWIVSDSAAESPGLSRRILIVFCLFLFAIGIEELIYFFAFAASFSLLAAVLTGLSIVKLRPEMKA